MTVTGTYDARDTNFASWSFSLLPFPLPSGSLTTSVPLAQFAAAYKGAPAKTLEQYVQE